MKPLKDYLPELKKIEGFPIGEDEDIIALSSPPYYTACPNPYIEDFIKEHGTPYDEETDEYNMIAYDKDISEGKGGQLYNVHTYHTKVPPEAIVRKILHYTKPGDIILDGFSGTGMTGVAATMCESKSNLKNILNRKEIARYEFGTRKVILSDISPIASFISSCYNAPFNEKKFETRAMEILREVDEECGWMYRTMYKGQERIIDYTVFSDVFICPYCSNEVVFWEIGVDKEKQRNLKEIACNHCQADLSNQVLKRSYIPIERNGEEVHIGKQVPVMIAFKAGKTKHTKNIDNYDKEVLNKIKRVDIPYWFPTNKLPKGYNTKQPISSHGITHIDLFYTKRNLYATSTIFNKIIKSDEDIRNHLLFWLQSIMVGQTKMNRYFEASFSQVNRYLKGTLYIGKKMSEVNFLYSLKGKVLKISKYLGVLNQKNTIVSTNSATHLPVPNDSIDYIFTDPPFGANIMYSEVNLIWESWLRLLTDNNSEAIINNEQNKQEEEYYKLMYDAFAEYYRVLKPNRWITIEFHNSKSSIWNLIQKSISQAGFIITHVGILDKKQKTFKQMTAPESAVKSDLVISAYKPSKYFETRFLSQGGGGMEIDFVREFLSNLPKEPVMERTDKMLYNKMLSQYIIRGYEINYDSNSFYKMLGNYFVEEDGYWFNENQLASYQGWKQKMRLEGMDEVQSGQRLLFVSDEKSALVWLYNFMSIPKSLDEIHGTFRKIANITDDTLPELTELLSDNFVIEDSKYRRPNSEDEKLTINGKREKQLMREFEDILYQAQNVKKKIKEVRKEALSFGFETCYKEKRFSDILTIAKKLDKRILENNSELNDFVKIAEVIVEDF
jgi:DNA modification methylase